MLNRPPPESPPEILPARLDLPINTNPPTKKEIEEAIRQIKSNKAAGPDHIPPEAIKADMTTSVVILHTLFTNVSYRVFNCILVHFIPLPVFIFYSFTGIYILLILFLYSILSTLFPCTLYGLIFPFLFLYFYSIFVYSFSLFSVPAWMGLYRRGWDYTAWSVFV